MPFFLIFASVLAVSLVSFVGVVGFSLSAHTLRKGLAAVVGLAIGALLGDAFIHIIPEAFLEGAPLPTSLLIIGGIVIFFLLETALHWHHHHSPDHAADCPHPIGRLTLLSDSFHNFIDGILIATSYLVSVEVGIATTIAVVLHEIPQEIGNFGVLIHAGYTRGKALWYNFLSALTAFLGAALALMLESSSAGIIQILLPITAGGFIYIALSDLVPELHKDTRPSSVFVQIIAILLGVLAMVALLALE